MGASSGGRRLRVWLVTIGEPLPTDTGGERLLRAGIVADMLARAGHEVVWWTSAFNHSLKSLRATEDRTEVVAPRYRLELLYGGGYDRNISLQRIRDHVRLAERFTERAPTSERPDVILCSVPPLELSLAAVEYGRRVGVPVVLDVRDLWPDIFTDVVPRPLRPLVRLATRRMDATADRACRGASAIWGHAPAFVDWGLRHAGRAPTAYDRAFPFGYASTRPAEEEIAAAEQSWRELDVTRRPGELIACFVGKIGHQTDVATLVDVAERLTGERNIRLVLCGNGDRLEALQARARGRDNILFAGWRRRAEIWTLLRMASIGIAPYVVRADFLATIPNKVPEYLSAGLAVALNLSSGLVHDLIHDHDCGFSYDASADRLANELVALRDDGARLARLRRNATRLFDAEFRAEHVYGGMIAALERIASRPPG